MKLIVSYVIYYNILFQGRGFFMKKRTREEIRKWFKDQNITQAQWARENGYTGQEVNTVLTGRAKCQYGRTREIAIKLNMQLDD